MKEKWRVLIGQKAALEHSITVLELCFDNADSDREDLARVNVEIQAEIQRLEQCVVSLHDSAEGYHASACFEDRDACFVEIDRLNQQIDALKGVI